MCARSRPAVGFPALAELGSVWWAGTSMDRDHEMEALRARLVAAEEQVRVLGDRERILQDRLDGFVANIPGVVWESFFRQQPEDTTVDYISERIESLSGYTVDEWMQPNF